MADSTYSFTIKNLDRKVWILSVTRFIRAFGRGSTFIFLPLIFIITYKVSFIETGLFLGSATLVMAFVQYYAGILTDKIGRRTILVYSQIPAVFFYLLIYYTVEHPFYFLILLGSWYGTIVINSIQYPAVQASVADVTSVRDRLSGYTIMRVMANLGIAVGPLIGAYMAQYGLQYIFLISSIATVVEIFMLFFLMGETYDPKTHEKLQKGQLTKVYTNDKFFVIFIVIGVLLQIFMRQRGSTFTVYTIVLQNLPYMYLGYIWALNGILVVSLQFPLLRLMTKIGNPMIWRGVGTIFYAISFLILTGSTEFLFLALFMTISTFGEDLLSPTTQSIITTLAPENMKGSYVGVYNLYSSFGGFGGAIIGLYLLFALQSVSYTYWFYISFGTLSVAVMYIVISGMFSRRMMEFEDTKVIKVSN